MNGVFPAADGTRTVLTQTLLLTGGVYSQLTQAVEVPGYPRDAGCVTALVCIDTCQMHTVRDNSSTRSVGCKTLCEEVCLWPNSKQSNATAEGVAHDARGVLAHSPRHNTKLTDSSCHRQETQTPCLPAA